MCVIIFTNYRGKNVLVKNRDVLHIPSVSIIHEIINGVEVAYIYDSVTGWIEGINEYGVGIINSTFAKSHNSALKSNKPHYSIKSTTILESLCFSNIHDTLNDIMNGQLEGHTLVCSGKDSYHIECTMDNQKYINKISSEKSTVYTNHGEHFSNAGCVTGKKGFSSSLRKKIAESELEKLNTSLLTMLNKNYIDLHPHFHLYRNERHKHSTTTSQLLLNLHDKELIYYNDKNESVFNGIFTNLPENYVPQIKITSMQIEKNMNPELSPVSREEFMEIYNKFSNKSFETFFLLLLPLLFLVYGIIYA